MSEFVKNKIDEIFEVIGTTNKFCVEFGIYDWNQDNTTRLIAKHGWKALWIEGDKGKHYRVSAVTNKYNINFVRSFITAENINDIFQKANVPEEFDFLNIDIDGMDYWILKALNYKPRAFTIEYNCLAPPPMLKVPEYNPEYIWDQRSQHGSSLQSLVNLAKTKGYELISCDNIGSNCFFVLKELFPLFNIEDNSPEKLFTRWNNKSALPWSHPGGPWLEI